MSHQDGLGDNGPETTGLSKPDDGDDRMEKKRENVAHARMVSNRRSSRIQDACGIRLPHGHRHAEGLDDLFRLYASTHDHLTREHPEASHVRFLMLKYRKVSVHVTHLPVFGFDRHSAVN